MKPLPGPGRFLVAALCLACAPRTGAAAERPNILVLISDDQSWLHTGANGSTVVKTPNFDRVAAEGVRFTHAFAGSPGCAPSRGAILSGQAFWRLREGAVQRSSFPGDIRVYPEVLEANGYHVGLQGKGWGPGIVRQRKNNPAGKAYRGFAEFLAAAPARKPFCFWFGSLKPHRPYKPGTGLRAGRTLEDAQLPSFLPDVPAVRGDLLDYYEEVEAFDHAVGGVLRTLDASGRASNTLVIVTSDNGMPFPRCKTTLYDPGVRMPLAVRWPARVKGGRVVDDFISLTDLAPTFLRAAGLDPLPEMTGRSFLDVLLSEKAGRVDPARDHATFGRERHGKSWPCRALRDDRFLYIRNFAPERIDGLLIDDSPSSKFVIAHAEDPSYRRCYMLAFGPRPAEELYDVREDPEQVRNLAAQPGRSAVLTGMRETLEAELRRTDDPRILGRGKEFDDYPGVKAN